MRGITKLLTALLFVALLNTGCLTRSLWNPEPRHAAHDPHLSLALAPDNEDVLVQYDENQSSKVRRRSYWLFDYALKGGTGRPDFVRPRIYTNLSLTPIPLSDPKFEFSAAPVGGFVAVPAFEQRSFELHRHGAPLGRFELPKYVVEAKPTFGRVALTPLTAVADGVIVVGAAVSIAGVFVIVEGLESSEDYDSDWVYDSGGTKSKDHSRAIRKGSD